MHATDFGVAQAREKTRACLIGRYGGRGDCRSHGKGFELVLILVV